MLCGSLSAIEFALVIEQHQPALNGNTENGRTKLNVARPLP